VNTDTKARFDAERTAAGYKYLDSLRELKGVGEPVGEGGAPELLPCPFCGADGSIYYHGEDYAGSSQVDVGCSGGCEITPRACGDTSPDAEQDEKWAVEIWNTRATQPATAPSAIALCLCNHLKSQYEAYSDHDECLGCRDLDEPCSEFRAVSVQIGAFSSESDKAREILCYARDWISDRNYRELHQRIAVALAATPPDITERRGQPFKEFLAEQMRDPEFAEEYRRVSAELDAEIVTERARRAAEKVAVWAGGKGRPDGKAIDEIADIIAAEFGGGDGGDGDEKGTQQ
jgi:hypothetical protein